MAKITAPVKDFNGDIAGVQFSNGSAETDNEAVISYCTGAGYKVELASDGTFSVDLQTSADNDPAGPVPAPEPEPEPVPDAPKPRRGAKPE